MATLVAYVPVLHQGYRQLFEKHALQVKNLYLVGPELQEEFDQLRKDIRALKVEYIQQAIQSWNLFENVQIANKTDLTALPLTEDIVMSDDDISHELAQKYLSNHKITYDPIFLRWDRINSLAEMDISYDQSMPLEGMIKEMAQLIEEEALKSSDWWRQVGSVIAKDGKVLIHTHNHHVPHEQMPYINGDPRSNFSRGLNLEISTAIHGEAAAIAQAAAEGISLQGADIFVSFFPCPPCAKLVAYSGIKRLFYTAGYAVLDGQSILKDQGVEIIQVQAK